jgi:16S rRNA (uracil1498-N3)-methyltransferase
VPALGDEARRAARLERWRRIVVEAAEQSGRTAVPRVSEPQPLTQALRTAADAVFCWEEERERRFSAAFRRAVEQGAGAVSLFVGPEGGFAAEEAQLAVESGALLASLGTRTLRSETAAVAALALALLEVS